MTRILIFLDLVWRTDGQYGFIDVDLAWTLSGILVDFQDELSNWETLK